MGIWSCLGTSIEEVKESLYQGKSGIGVDQDRMEYGFRSGLTGIVKRPVLKGVLDRRTRMGLSEEAEYAFMASKDAFQMAGIDDQYLLDNEVGVIFGNDSSAAAVVESDRIMREKHDSAMIGSGLIFQGMNSTVNMNMNTIFHLRGVNFSVSSACASGSHSIGLSYLLIKQGLQDVILCGGAQEVNKWSMSSFDALNAFSIRMDDPTKASRPFDKDRDGLVPSGGAAALVLEDYEGSFTLQLYKDDFLKFKNYFQKDLFVYMKGRVTQFSRLNPDGTEYKFTVQSNGGFGGGGSSIIYVVVGKEAGAKPEFTQVVR